MKPVVALTVGDWNGIGPEIIVKCIHDRAIRSICTPLLVGPPAVFAYYAALSGVPFTPTTGGGVQNGTVRIHPVTVPRPAISPGRVSRAAGAAAGLAIREAVRLALAGTVDAIVTAPVSKEAFHRSGIRFPGQTEFLQHLTGKPPVAMILASERLRVGLVTIHIPLARVARSLTRGLIVQRTTTVHNALKSDWRIASPRLAMLGLNPHAGEQGDIGDEEQTTIRPALTALRRRGMAIEGPFPADAFFGRYTPGSCDAVIAMYHDQGLIPLKMSSMGSAVNVTAGMPVVRTSPDHGTAFDIAGKNCADPSSMRHAIRLAVTFAKNRHHLRASA